MTPLLELRAISKEFPTRSAFLRRRVGTTRAVEAVDLTLHRGETLGLVGESGSGKTTIGRIALGLIEPTAGHVLLEGTDLATMHGRDRMKIRRRVQFVFQDPYSSLDPFAPIGHSIAEPLRSHRIGNRAEQRARVNELLEMVGLRPALAERYPREFSGGQLQRIAIARALAVNPDLIILDEPVSSLDVSTQADVINLIAQLQADLGVAYLFIAHDLAVVDHVSNRIAVMYLGQIVETGPADEVIRRPQHPYTHALLAAVPGRDGRPGAAADTRTVLRGELPSSLHNVEGCRFHARCLHTMEICRNVPPELTTSNGIAVRCHLYPSGSSSPAAEVAVSLTRPPTADRVDQGHGLSRSR